jgi:hypothetical protein
MEAKAYRSLKSVPAPSHTLPIMSNYQLLKGRVFRNHPIYRIFLLQPIYIGTRVGWSRFSLVRETPTSSPSVYPCRRVLFY